MGAAVIVGSMLILGISLGFEEGLTLGSGEGCSDGDSLGVLVGYAVMVG